MKKKAFRSLGLLFFKSMVSIILMVLIMVFALYMRTTIYVFPEAKPFKGDFIHNPYQNIANKTFKANFHAHSNCWDGVTNGADTDNMVIEAYIDHGYDVACLSNYHKISPYTGSKSVLNIPIYEHGYSVGKAHCLAINAKKVFFWDFPLWQTSSHQQSNILSLSKDAELVALAHPKFGGGRTFKNMEDLTGYHFTEVLNHYRISDEYWDSALSVGRLSWILGNDDIHAISDGAIFKMWNTIFSDSSDSLLTNLKNGRSYATYSKIKKAENSLLSCELLKGDTLQVTLSVPADVYFLGQNGIEKQRSLDTDTATYAFLKDDTYIRIVAKNDNSDMYLNPLVRYDGKHLNMASDMEVKINLFMTWIWRVGSFLLLLGTILILRKVILWNPIAAN